MFKKISTLVVGTLVSFALSAVARAQERIEATDGLGGMFHVGLEFGEIPFHGSFKPGISIGYHVNDLVYLGFVYQFADAIQRDDTSFNANAIGIEGLVKSFETVGQRAYLQARVRPHRYSPYLSFGFVFNDRDTETLTFDDRSRPLGGRTETGPVTIVQSRPPGLRPALGLGYSFTFDNGLSLFTEWAGWWLFGAPEPEVSYRDTTYSAAAREQLTEHIAREFIRSPFNTYHVFQLGAGYTF